MTYEYLCTACGHQWEAEQRISADPLKKCPKCNQESAKRLVSGGMGFILKGGGWYADGYGLGAKKNGSGGSGASTDVDKSEASEPAGSGKQETKSDTKKKAGAEKGSQKSKSAAA